jgi:hypothetical protein
MLKKFERQEWPLFYLSGRVDGTAAEEEEWVKRSGCDTRCFSYAFVSPDAFYATKRMVASYEMSKKLKCRIMMDSSAHSFQQFARNGQMERVEENRKKTLDGYIKFVERDSEEWDFYFNFDYRVHAPTVYKMQRFLEKRGLHPVPVFHGDDGMDWLRRYIDEGHKLVGISVAPSIRGTWKGKRFYLDQVFDLTEKSNVAVHGLALTSLSIAFSYPFYSIDSTTWIRQAAFGAVAMVNPVTHVMEYIHVSERNCGSGRSSYNFMPQAVRKEIRRKVELSGFDFDKLRKDLKERAIYTGYVFSHMSEMGIEKGRGKVQWARLL